MNFMHALSLNYLKLLPVLFSLLIICLPIAGSKKPTSEKIKSKQINNQNAQFPLVPTNQNTQCKCMDNHNSVEYPFTQEKLSLSQIIIIGSNKPINKYYYQRIVNYEVYSQNGNHNHQLHMP